MNFGRGIVKSFLDLIYPPICFHCKNTLEDENPYLCKSCLLELALIDPIDRCPYCFSSEFNRSLQSACLNCIEKPLFIDRAASVFDYEGPAASLVKQFKYGNQSYLANGLGAYLAAQFINLDWPMPDIIVPVPMSRLKKINRGFNQSALLAKSFASIIERPVLEVLKRQSGDFSQASLDYHQRVLLTDSSFALKEPLKIYGKTVLLIDDCLTTGTTLKCCAEALLPSFPSSIYALTLCRSL